LVKNQYEGYEYIDPNHQYTYPNSTVLINKQNITNIEEAYRNEHLFVTKRLADLRLKTIEVYSISDILAIHKYLFQDVFYLEKYVELCELALTKADNEKEREVLYSLIEFSGLVELQTRFDFFNCKNDDNKELFFETKQYINFIMSFSEDEDNFKLMVVLMNCMLSYNYIFTIIASFITVSL